MRINKPYYQHNYTIKLDIFCTLVFWFLEYFQLCSWFSETWICYLKCPDRNQDTEACKHLILVPQRSLLVQIIYGDRDGEKSRHDYTHR